MIELDYAFLADYASVQDGKLTVVGASFIGLHVGALPAETMLSVAGRVRCPKSLEVLRLKIEVRPPNGEYRIDADLQLDDLHHHAGYLDKRGVLFAVQMAIPLPVVGLYVINVIIDGSEKEIDRTLKFMVGMPEQQ